jgi:hypothetical protein
MSFFEYDDCFAWRCNGEDCAKQVVFPPTDFWDCVAEMKSRGWSFSRDDEAGEWTHYCQRCMARHRQRNWMDEKVRSVKGGRE